MADKQGWHFWMDTGGTFTDCLARDPAGEWLRAKVLSSGVLRTVVTARPGPCLVELGAVAPAAGRALAGFALRRPGEGESARVDSWDPRLRIARLDRDSGLDVGQVVELSTGEEAPVLAMRLLTGTAADGSLPPAVLRLATTRGTNALLEGKGARVALFVTEGFGDLLAIGDQRRPDLFAIRVERPAPLYHRAVEVRGRLRADGSELVPLDRDALRVAARAARADGCEVAAVALLHSYRNPAHERAVATELRQLGFAHVSVSSDLAAQIKLVPRAETAVVDATLAPVMEQYLAGVATAVDPAHLRIMTSAGGMVSRAAYRPKDSLLSGPAGGVAGAAGVARRAGLERVITFDMGGTSTDVARCDGDFDYQFQHAVGGARVLAPALRVESVAAGGGSVCRFDGTALVVGPDSAGAQPGPACYGAGGPLTLTDVNLLLGRLDPQRFAVPVFPQAAEETLAAVLAGIARVQGGSPSRQDVLRGFLEVANERMAEAIRRISVREGYDPAEYTLVAFGGAGGLHACAVASRLGMRRVLHPADSGLLSARGLAWAREERIVEAQVLRPLDAHRAALPEVLARLEEEGRAELRAAGVDAEAVQLRRAEVELRFAGQDAGLAVEARPLDTLEQRFTQTYRQRFGYAPEDRKLECVTARVVVSTRDPELEAEHFSDDAEGRAAPLVTAPGRATAGSSGFAAGPRLVQDGFSTLFVEAGWTVHAGSQGSLLLECAEEAIEAGAPRSEVVDLELFTSRYRSLVEDMGQLLQRCALSVNIKERLDFSCALLDASGELVANAPHVPVHLGALGLCVRKVADSLDLRDGDVAITNHPGFGGAHLPDVTLVAPVFDPTGALLGYVANRAHHAEIGGVRPGSMPPQATSLVEEGVVLAPRYLLRGETADWSGLRDILLAGPHPTRRVEENLADLHAQLASIRLGTGALRDMARRHGASCVRHYMHRLKERAAAVLADALGAREFETGFAADQLDDGTPVVVRLDRKGTRLCVDFSGSGPVHRGNLNATPAIVRSALIYVLRLMAARELPLNEGLMRDVDLVVPAGLLSPEFPDDPARCPAVVGGNVETSQRVVDVLLRALQLAASSQGTMNNVIFGNERFSYYETIGGGTGAGPSFHGCSGIHSHMTNTAITDPEILEARLPVRLERFGIRRGSGGAGHYRGGDGLERVFRFLDDVDVSLITQRRRSGPPGLCGGGEGVPGEQWIEQADGLRRALQAVSGASCAEGDCLVIRTPGGGGWGG